MQIFLQEKENRRKKLGINKCSSKNKVLKIKRMISYTKRQGIITETEDLFQANNKLSIVPNVMGQSRIRFIIYSLNARKRTKKEWKKKTIERQATGKTGIDNELKIIVEIEESEWLMGYANGTTTTAT